ncbi:MAG: Uncharacterised protein [Acidimicrobiales bacterium AG-410-I20]|nr:MAG: Uncharacterised protein [Acidimicrobiales bacterium AG-410-I20]
MSDKNSSYSGLFLTPGAGSNRDHSTLCYLEKLLHPLPVERFDFQYRKQGKHFPAPVSNLVSEVKDAVEKMSKKHGVESQDLILGGRSMGGRVCSMAVAEGLPTAGLILICYPLHPAKKPETLRVGHFPSIKVPCLFISGDKDEFGTPEEFSQHLPKISGPVTTVYIEGKRHDLKGADERIGEAAIEWLNQL